MPMKYVAEMFCDRLAACKVYMGDSYTDASPSDYFKRGFPEQAMHPDTMTELRTMLLVLKNEGEDAAFRYVKQRLKEEKG